MKCILVDDDEMSRLNLERLCNKIEDLEIVSICNDGMQAISALEENEVDLLFLEIEMPDLSGMEMVKSLANLPQIIFTTNRTDFALEAFEYDVTDYVTKPITLPRLIKAFNKAKGRLQKNDSTDKSTKIYLRSEGKFVNIDLEEVVFIETMDDYLVFHLDNEDKHIIHSSLKKMDDKLKGLFFLKVHRSYIINLKKIKSIEDTHVLMDKKVIPVSRAHRSILMEKVNLL